MDELKGKYIGIKKIKSAEIINRETCLKNSVVGIIYEDSSLEEIPKELAIVMATDEPKDATYLRDLQIKPVVEKVLGILLDSEVKVIDVDYILQRVAQSLNHNIDLAEEKLWEKSKYDRNLYDIQKVFN